MQKKIKNIIEMGEGYFVEFKESMDKSLIEEVCAFANSEGGKVILGVSDKGKITGIDTSNKARSKVQDILRQLQPQNLDIKIDIIDNLIVIDVPEGEDKPYACSRGFFKRIGSNTQKLLRNEIMDLYKKEGRICFEELVNEKADFETDFDLHAFKHFLNLSRITSTLGNKKLLQNLDCLTEDNRMTNLGVLFFSKDIDFIMNHASVDCLLFEGTEKVKILDRQQHKAGLIQNIESTLAFIQRHTNVEYIIDGRPRREEVRDYPAKALREAIVNAVCHRDYFDKRCHVVVEVFSDRLEIYNPGGLPGDLPPEEFGTKSVPRNLLIASMLHRADYIEQAGTGINRMKEAVSNHKKKVELEIQYKKDSLFYSLIFRKGSVQRNTENTPKEILKDKKRKNGKAENKENYSYFNDLKEKHFFPIFGVSVNEFRSIFGVNILNTAWLIHKDPEITAKGIAEKLSVTKRTAENYLSKLKENKFIERVASDKAGYWKVLKPKKLKK